MPRDTWLVPFITLSIAAILLAMTLLIHLLWFDGTTVDIVLTSEAPAGRMPELTLPDASLPTAAQQVFVVDNPGAIDLASLYMQKNYSTPVSIRQLLLKC